MVQACITPDRGISGLVDLFSFRSAGLKRRRWNSLFPCVSCWRLIPPPPSLSRLSLTSNVSGSAESRVRASGAGGARPQEDVLPFWENPEPVGDDIGKPPKGGRFSKEKLLSKTKQKAISRAKVQRPPEEIVLELFHSTFREQYGERWDTLFPALQGEIRHCCLINKHACPEDVQLHLDQIDSPTAVDLLSLPCYSSPSRFPQPQKDRHGTTSYYLLDAASVMAAAALQVAPDERVLDLCAAPGGKSLAILQMLGPGGSLIANELSQARRRRLHQVLRDYLPEPVRECVRVTGHDGASWREGAAFDKVLVDAPCSSERHVLTNTTELVRWTPQRTRNCARRQVSLLNSALQSARIGGTVVYSTCSISATENDDIIAKILAKGKARAEVVREEWRVGEETKFGCIFLPDRYPRWGPLYIAVLRRLAEDGQEGR